MASHDSEHRLPLRRSTNVMEAIHHAASPDERTYPRPPYSPPAGRNFPTRPFFGDTHLHTSFSMDEGAFGARLTPRDGYRFAKGEEIAVSNGQRVKLSRPLDFLVVADHSDNMGFFPQLFAGKPEMLADPIGRRWYDMIQTGKGADAVIEIIVSFSQGTFPRRSLPCRERPRTNPPGRRRSRWPRRLTIPGASQPLSVTNLEHRRQQSAPQRDLP
jgi:Protein of unknown function (DUF3604)